MDSPEEILLDLASPRLSAGAVQVLEGIRRRGWRIVFADLSLTTWVPRPEIYVSADAQKVYGSIARLDQQNAPAMRAWASESMERETGFEPATSTLARSHSTTELLPLSSEHYKRGAIAQQTFESNQLH